MDLGHIHLKDFPGDRIVIFLEDNFREHLINTAVKLFGRKDLAKRLGVKKLDTITRWKQAEIKRAKNWITPQGIPLDKFKILSKLLGIYLDQAEKYVTAYKSKGKSLLINNPNLPIRESPELFRIMAHMMGDGSANKNNVNYFKNFDKSIYDEFANDLRYVFGNLELSLNKDNIVFPISITHILSKFYNINFGTFNAEIPKKLLELSSQCAGAFIQGFFDDEGSVSTSCARFYSYNKKLLQGVRSILIKKFPGIKSITSIKDRVKKTGVEYYFSINADGLKSFYNLIGCVHPCKKEKLEFYLKRKNKDWNHRGNGDTKSKILESLSDNPKTIYELSRDLIVSRETVRTHLFGYYAERKKNAKGLIEQRFVKIKEFGKYNTAIFKLNTP